MLKAPKAIPIKDPKVTNPNTAISEVVQVDVLVSFTVGITTLVIKITPKTNEIIPETIPFAIL